MDPFMSHDGHNGHMNHSDHMSHGDHKMKHSGHEGHKGHGGHGGHSGCNSTIEGSYTVWLHILAIFVLLTTSFLGTMLPLAGKYISALRVHPFVYVIGKCISTGVIIAVALLFIINHAIHGLQEDCLPDALKSSYPAYALLFTLIAAILMHALDVQIDAFLENWVMGAAVEEAAPIDTTDLSGKVAGPAAEDNPAPFGGACHGHGTAAAARLHSMRRVTAVIFLEFGLALHSVFLGISVGIANDKDTKVLIIALAFHQLFEGLALGSRLAEASMSALWEILLTAIFSLSLPLGVAVGLGAVKGSNVSLTGSAFVTIQAVFNALCGGMLLYIGFSLLLTDFPTDLRRHAGMGSPHRGIKRFAMLLSLWGGTAVMALLGKWH